MILTFNNARIIDPETGQERFGAVVIEDDKIAEILDVDATPGAAVRMAAIALLTRNMRLKKENGVLV